jgi:Xaa-Pro aminopeptidase
MTRADEFNVKVERMRERMKERRWGALALSRSDNFAWATCGGSCHVNMAAEAGVASLVILPDRCVIVTNRIESARIREEEIAGLDADLVEIPWAEDRNAKIFEMCARAGAVATDIPSPGFVPAGEDFADLMMELTESEMDRFRALGADAGAALETAARSLTPGMSENAAAAALASECWKRDAQPIVVLVASGDRLPAYRHPLPTPKPLARAAMLVLCARRSGLVASATRMVSFGPATDELRRRHISCCRVDAAFNTLTRTGASISAIFRDATAIYTREGFDREWLLHHQGGPCGYRSRYFCADPDSPGRVKPNCAFAWNPSITGTKSEDTIIAFDDRAEFITRTGEWPELEVDFQGARLSRADILEL